MTSRFIGLLTVFGILGSSIIFTNTSHGDPLSGEIPKFAQEPMIATPVAGQIYFGHDELSTAYGVGTAAQPPLNYQGRFMADDFADNFNTPVVHLTWWGSYLNDNVAAAPQPHVKNFLIAFESDVPAQPGGFSQPGQVLQYDVVSAGALAPGSGTFTETLERPADPVLGEALYKYNAELHLGHEFFQKQDTVYWLKIAALVDVPQPIVVPPPPGTTQWGWHNRDYTIQDPLASPNVAPGEFVEGVVGGNQPVWHFQDDAVQGDLRFTPGAPIPSQAIVQLNSKPQNYVFVNSAGVGPIDGPVGIDVLSKDLAFRLYTTVPEPATCSLVALGLAAVFATRRRSA